MPDNEYPRVLYRDGSQEDVWGKKCDLHNVGDADELAAALADGWSLTPDGEPAAKPKRAPKVAAVAVADPVADASAELPAEPEAPQPPTEV